ncbi:hypothetical protein B0H10DRAFT_1940574 [Mycena sp. CBHHK59/15]|nr:hypothetical protein B0H10DRAFT_1940574 [Mycena sp. CBHHK59/15]
MSTLEGYRGWKSDFKDKTMRCDVDVMGIIAVTSISTITTTQTCKPPRPPPPSAKASKNPGPKSHNETSSAPNHPPALTHQLRSSITSEDPVPPEKCGSPPKATPADDQPTDKTPTDNADACLPKKNVRILSELAGIDSPPVDSYVSNAKGPNTPPPAHSKAMSLACLPCSGGHNMSDTEGLNARHLHTHPQPGFDTPPPTCSNAMSLARALRSGGHNTSGAEGLDTLLPVRSKSILPACAPRSGGHEDYQLTPEELEEMEMDVDADQEEEDEDVVLLLEEDEDEELDKGVLARLEFSIVDIEKEQEEDDDDAPKDIPLPVISPLVIPPPDSLRLMHSPTCNMPMHCSHSPIHRRPDEDEELDKEVLARLGFRITDLEKEEEDGDGAQNNIPPPVISPLVTPPPNGPHPTCSPTRDMPVHHSHSPTQHHRPDTRSHSPSHDLHMQALHSLTHQERNPTLTMQALPAKRAKVKGKGKEKAPNGNTKKSSVVLRREEQKEGQSELKDMLREWGETNKEKTREWVEKFHLTEREPVHGLKEEQPLQCEVWKLGVERNARKGPGEQLLMKELQDAMHNDPTKLTEAEKVEILAKFEVAKEREDQGMHGTNPDAAKDATWIGDKIYNEPQVPHRGTWNLHYRLVQRQQQHSSNSSGDTNVPGVHHLRPQNAGRQVGTVFPNWSCLLDTSADEQSHVARCTKCVVAVKESLLAKVGKPVKMEYTDHERKINLWYGFWLVGWPKDLLFKALSNVGSGGMEGIKELLSKLEDRSYRWEAILRDEYEALKKKYADQPGKPTKKWVDAGKKRGEKLVEEEEEEENKEDKEVLAKKEKPKVPVKDKQLMKAKAKALAKAKEPTKAKVNSPAARKRRQEDDREEEGQPKKKVKAKVKATVAAKRKQVQVDEGEEPAAKRLKRKVKAKSKAVVDNNNNHPVPHHPPKEWETATDCSAVFLR